MNEAIAFILNSYRDLAKDEAKKYWQWILQNGESFDAFEPMDKHLKKVVKPRIRQCYKNSQYLATLRPSEYKYYEGWMYEEGLVPIEHAWLVKDGKVIDLTLSLLPDRKPVHYFGVHIPIKQVFKVQCATKMYSDVLWRYYHELQKEEIKVGQ